MKSKKTMLTRYNTEISTKPPTTASASSNGIYCMCGCKMYYNGERYVCEACEQEHYNTIPSDYTVC